MSFLPDVSPFKELANSKSYNRPQYDDDNRGDRNRNNTEYSCTLSTPTNLRQWEVYHLEYQAAVVGKHEKKNVILEKKIMELIDLWTLSGQECNLLLV